MFLVPQVSRVVARSKQMIQKKSAGNFFDEFDYTHITLNTEIPPSQTHRTNLVYKKKEKRKQHGMSTNFMQ